MQSTMVRALNRIRNGVLLKVPFAVLVVLLIGKALWGYWERDLTFGDTASYFYNAVDWHYDGLVNFVWSPLYTAYFGSWLSVTDNALVVVFLHRVALILMSTGLLAWFALKTLPRTVAFIFVAWWVSLPIHYDTLYEVHLFGALPVFLMALVSVLASGKWREPLLLGLALITTILVRNEYVLAVAIFVFLYILRAIALGKKEGLVLAKTNLSRFGVVFGVVVLLSGYFYSASYVQGEEIRKWSSPKHTLNMCQVYAFGYQQREEDWKGSPWVECSSLMERQFGKPYPSLTEMIFSNPEEVGKHFLWNISLTKAGMEVLLFNATTSLDNPDYAPVKIKPLIPSLLLGLSILLALAGGVYVYRNVSSSNEKTKNVIAKMFPLILAVLIMAAAVILTQRPRPSYLLGLGALYIWVCLILFSALIARYSVIGEKWFTSAVAAIIIIVIPSYSSLSLPSKDGSLGDIYSLLLPHAETICQSPGGLAVNDYAFEINSYLCAPYGGVPKSLTKKGYLTVGALSSDVLSSPAYFVKELETRGIDRVIIDPYLTLKFPALGGCAQLRESFVANDWKQLVYSNSAKGSCISAYSK